MGWQIHVGDKVLPTIYEGTTHAVQEFMRSEQRNACGGDSIKEFGVYIINDETFESYKLAYQGDRVEGFTVATCGGGIVLQYDKLKQSALLVEEKENAKMFAWMNERSRWASCSAHFERGGVYRDHVVVFYDAKIGWIHATPGNGYKEAVRNAMNMRINYETQEYFDPA